MLGHSSVVLTSNTLSRLVFATTGQPLQSTTVLTVSPRCNESATRPKHPVRQSTERHVWTPCANGPCTINARASTISTPRPSSSMSIVAEVAGSTSHQPSRGSFPIRTGRSGAMATQPLASASARCAAASGG